MRHTAHEVLWERWCQKLHIGAASFDVCCAACGAACGTACHTACCTACCTAGTTLPIALYLVLSASRHLKITVDVGLVVGTIPVDKGKTGQSSPHVLLISTSPSRQAWGLHPDEPTCCLVDMTYFMKSRGNSYVHMCFASSYKRSSNAALIKPGYCVTPNTRVLRDTQHLPACLLGCQYFGTRLPCTRLLQNTML